ncbi:hypothetical protein MFM001_29310 [Mycobacterium sp. MFM001]|nr:hypothetical protein MFM001_29310 [Mycobacterium sp. MFM001]
MADNIEEKPAQASVEPVLDSVGPDELSAVHLVIASGEPQRVGRFWFFLDGQRWEWSDAVARMHGYEPGTVVPTTELLLQHKHPEDRQRVAAVLGRVLSGESRSASLPRGFFPPSRARCQPTPWRTWTTPCSPWTSERVYF